MSDDPRTGSSAEIPTPSPRDLYPTSDIRFVIYEIGGLTAKVDRLIEDVRGHGQKVDDVSGKMTFFRGAFWVVSGVALALAGAVWWLFTNHATITFH